MSARERAHKLKDSYVGAVGNARQKGGGGKRGYKPPGRTDGDRTHGGGKPPGRTDGDRTHGGGWTEPGGWGGGEFLTPERGNPQPGPGGPGRGDDIRSRPPGNFKPGPGGPGGGSIPSRPPGNFKPGPGGPGRGGDMPGRTDPGFTAPAGGGGKRRRRNR